MVRSDARRGDPCPPLLPSGRASVVGSRLHTAPQLLVRFGARVSLPAVAVGAPLYALSEAGALGLVFLAWLAVFTVVLVLLSK